VSEKKANLKIIVEKFPKKNWESGYLLAGRVGLRVTVGFLVVISSSSCTLGSFGRALFAVGIAAIKILYISSRWSGSSITKNEKKFQRL
jgi:hypothetical protein